MPLAAEGTMQAVCQLTGAPFHRIKIMFDCSMVVISLAVCLIATHSLGSVGIGTVVAAVLVGVILGFLNRRFGAWRDKLLGLA
jgi:uncharacterized membrane protein YczE